jgi:hypothetical protein
VSANQLDYTNSGMMIAYLKNSLTKLEMDDPNELNKQVLQEEKLQREDE